MLKILLTFYRGLAQKVVHSLLIWCTHLLVLCMWIYFLNIKNINMKGKQSRIDKGERKLAIFLSQIFPLPKFHGPYAHTLLSSCIVELKIEILQGRRMISSFQVRCQKSRKGRIKKATMHSCQRKDASWFLFHFWSNETCYKRMLQISFSDHTKPHQYLQNSKS